MMRAVYRERETELFGRAKLLFGRRASRGLTFDAAPERVDRARIDLAPSSGRQDAGRDRSRGQLSADRARHHPRRPA